MDLNNHSTNLSRRDFLQGLGSFCAAGTLLSLSTVSISHAHSFSYFQGDIPLEQLNYAIFSKLQGDQFSIQLSPEMNITAQLVEVKKSFVQDDRQEGFSLLFEADSNHSLEQRMYDFKHPSIGNCAIFIVPVGCDGTTSQYEAVFNRLYV